MAVLLFLYCQCSNNRAWNTSTQNCLWQNREMLFERTSSMLQQYLDSGYLSKLPLKRGKKAKCVENFVHDKNRKRKSRIDWIIKQREEKELTVVWEGKRGNLQRWWILRLWFSQTIRTVSGGFSFFIILMILIILVIFEQIQPFLSKYLCKNACVRNWHQCL